MYNMGVMMCIISRSMLNELKMNKSELVKVTEHLAAANGNQITLNGAMFLNLGHSNKKTMQMV